VAASDYEMPCYFPLHGFRSQTVTKNGKRKLAFSESTGYRDLPVTVPCGQCVGCRLERSRQWALRLYHESKFHERSCFVTLTYSDENIPSGGTLVKSHVQGFLKRLRKHYGGGIRYFHCGEYGETNPATGIKDGGLYRPHYHACLFGVDFRDADPEKTRKFHSRNAQGDTLWKSPILEHLWGHGQCLIGNFTAETAAYTARYLLKKVSGDAANIHYEALDMDTGEVVSRLPEYITMSTRPGIGARWFEQFGSDVFPRDECILHGKQVVPPRYYFKLFEKENAKKAKSIKYARIRSAAAHKADHTPERLAVKHVVKTSQIKTLSRKL